MAFSSSTKRSFRQAPHYTAGNYQKDMIVLHWWDLPSKRPTFDGVVSWFFNPASGVSIHYQVEANRVLQMVREKDMAWHAGNLPANRRSIGIEINPRLSDGDYETAAEVIADIWKRRGKLPLRRHREFTGTTCPGTLDVNRLYRLAEALYSGKATPAPVSTPKPPKAPSKADRPTGNAPWPKAYLTSTGTKNQYQDKALKKLLGDTGYSGTLAMRLQRHLRAKGYYKGYITWASAIGPKTTRAWQEFLKDRKFYSGAIDGSWGPNTVRATVAFLNDQAKNHYPV
jgi:N-acetylmuramoyl-L-alanine amidase CwlA